MADRRTIANRSRERGSTADEHATGTTTTTAGARHEGPSAEPTPRAATEIAVLPDDPTELLDDKAPADLSTGTSEPVADTIESVGGDAMGIAGPDRSDVDAIVELGGEPADIDVTAEELDSLLEAPDYAGGLDGRNPAADGGGSPGVAGGQFAPDGSSDPDLTVDSTMGGGSGVDAALIGGDAAGTLPIEQQAAVDYWKGVAERAMQEGDFAGANTAAERVHAIVNPTPQSGETSDEGRDLELITDFGLARDGKKQVWDDDVGEVVEVDSLKGVKHDNFGSEGSQMKRTGTDSKGDGGDGTGQPPPSAPGGADDRAPEGDAPDPHRDFTDAFLESKLGADRGGDIDPGPDDVGGGPIGEVPTDFTSPVAQFGPDAEPVLEVYDVHDAGDLQPDLTPEEEFFDV